jgi:O-antigen ligase
METILEIVLAFLVIGLTLAFGGVQQLAYSIGVVVLFLSVLLLMLKQTKEGSVRLPLPLWPVVFAVWVAFPAIPLPEALVARLSPARQLNTDLSGLSRGMSFWTTISIYPHDTLISLIKFLAYLSAFLLAAYLFDSTKRKSYLLRALIFLGFFEAAYGIIQYLTGSPNIFTFRNPFFGAAATGTYINRNHFAGLLELTFPFTVAFAFYSLQIRSQQRRGRSGPGGASVHPSFYAVLGLIMVVSLIFSRSRGGILSSTFSLIFVALLAQFRTQQRVWMLGIFVFLVCVVGYGLWIGLDPVLARFEEMREPGYLQIQGRISIWKDAAGMIRDNPVCGTGLGTFGLAFRSYQTSVVESYVDHAHNDYLEFLSETGLVGIALLFSPIFYIWIRMVVSFLDDPRGYRGAITLGCIGSILAILLHSITDFNLQIPANALIFAVVLGIGYKASIIERRKEPPLRGTLDGAP